MRILIVDGSHAMRRVLVAILGHLGYVDIIETTNGLDASSIWMRAPLA